MQFVVSPQLLRLSLGQHFIEGEIVSVDDVGFSVKTTLGERFSFCWELLRQGLIIERLDEELRRAA